MANDLDLGASTTRWDEAFDLVDRWFALSAAGVTRLGADARHFYPDRAAKDGWRVPIEFASGTRRLDVLVGDTFPFEPPLVTLVDRPPHLTWPHLESDGLICLLPNGSTVTPNDPLAVIKHLLDEVVHWFEVSEAGSNLDDFRAEFLSYWSADPDAPLIRSLLEPNGPSRAIAIHRTKGLYILAETATALTRWLDHALPDKSGKTRQIDPALLIWLNQPMLPSEYPGSTTAVIRQVRKGGLGGELERLGAEQLQRIVVVFGADSQNGPVFAAVILRPAVEGNSARGANTVGTIERGFRPGRTPSRIVAQRVLGSARTSKANVQRIDTAWIHGRDANPDVGLLRAAKIIVIGCGSLGGPVALSLAQAGIGSLDLIDPGILRAANVGRHPLGASEIGMAKSRALVGRIKADYPHILRAEAHFEGWEAFAARKPEVLARADLLISTIGVWAPEAALNAWRHDQQFRPDLLFGWTEPHAVAGHAVGLVRAQGCLACGLTDWGEPLHPVAAWPDGAGVRGEPACGVMYQPYGAVEAAHVSALITEAAIDIVLDRAEAPFHRIWVARESILSRAGGVWSEAWSKASGGVPEAARVVERIWAKRDGCPICSTSRP
ncbi:MAG: E2/UBC family protein [Dehalococcoidia bacterium]